MTIRFLKSRTTLEVRNVPASIAFYQQALDFDVIVTLGEPPTFALIGDGDVGLGLSQAEHPTVAALACCYFDVASVEELHERCSRAGATIINPLTHQLWGNYDFVIADPDGHRLAFGEVPSESAPA